MRGASRDAQAAAADRLDALLRASGEGEEARAAATRTGEQLLAVAHLLDANGGLRRALTDPSRDGEDKASLVRRLLGGQLDEGTTDLVAGVVRSRWGSAGDLADALEELGLTALVAAAEAVGRLDEVEDQVFRFGRVVAGDPQLRAALADRAATPVRREALVRRLLEGRAAPEALLLVREVVVSPRGRRLDDAFEAVGRVAARRRERLVASVTAAVPLTAEQRDRLERALSRLYGRTMQLHVDVDPDVVGGLRVQVGDEVLDATVLAKLHEARRTLTGGD